VNATIASITARALLGRRRFLLLLPLPLLLVGLAWLAHGLDPDPSAWGEPVVAGLGFAVVLPMIALVVGTGVLGAEIDDGTIVHVLATPVARRDIVLAKLAVAAGVTTAVTATAMFLTGVIVGSVRFGLGLAVACVVCSIAYSAVFLALSLLTRRPVLLGLLYVLIWEGLLGNLLAGSRVLRQPLRLWRWRVSWPSTSTAARQILTGAVDWGLAAWVLYLLMPNAVDTGFGHFMAIFVLAQIAGLVSHVPGGLGVFEAVMLAGFGATGNEGLEAPILGALAAYRLIYYFLPLCAATVVVLAREARGVAGKVPLAPWFTGLLPPFFAGLTLVSGAVLLFSGATSALPGRMEILRHVLPLPVLEFSHFFASMVGMLLLILARGLQRRLDAAYVLTLVLLLLGAVLSLLKGIDYEEATLLSLLALGLAPAHRLFYRRASLFSATFSVGWIIAILAVLGCAGWLVSFSYKHVEYSTNLWWEFSFYHGGAPRALRALVGATAVGMLFALANLIRPARPQLRLPGEEELARALPLIKHYSSAQAHLALMSDKTLLFDSESKAFIMYDVEGRSWVAMGDPVGEDEDARRELVWTFREQCERAGGWPLFYQVRPQDLDLYLEVGMNLLKIGEEARVKLDGFNLDGKSKKVLRNTINKLTRDGMRLEIVAADRVPALIPQLKTISDAWMRDKGVREKGFSLGTFDPAYLARTPMALVWKGEELVAFANLFLTDSKEEASVDLMRHLPDGTSGVMDFMFIELMQWARGEGYVWFNLGMAPFSGLQNRRTAPLWSRLGALVFGRGERFYNFRGLHKYKDKFDPEWEPRYLAVPAGIALPLVLANIASLISGGLSGMVRR